MLLFVKSSKKSNTFSFKTFLEAIIQKFLPYIYIQPLYSKHSNVLLKPIFHENEWNLESWLLKWKNNHGSFPLSCN